EDKKEKPGKADGGDQKKDAAAAAQPIVLKVDLHCAGCATKVKRAIKNAPGVESVKTDTAANKVVVTGAADAAEIKERIEARTKKPVQIVSAGAASPNKDNKEKDKDKKPDAGDKPEKEKSKAADKEKGGAGAGAEKKEKKVETADKPKEEEKKPKEPKEVRPWLDDSVIWSRDGDAQDQAALRRLHRPHQAARQQDQRSEGSDGGRCQGPGEGDWHHGRSRPAGLPQGQAQSAGGGGHPRQEGRRQERRRGEEEGQGRWRGRRKEEGRRWRRRGQEGQVRGVRGADAHGGPEHVPDAPTVRLHAVHPGARRLLRPRRPAAEPRLLPERRAPVPAALRDVPRPRA
uniref:HMA domain-containing protein n=1 Tax=Aegilops tauschii subsp. strangulata TaxID=200361 RepID=A0A452YB17_AEGTS